MKGISVSRRDKCRPGAQRQAEFVIGLPSIVYQRIQASDYEESAWILYNVTGEFREKIGMYEARKLALALRNYPDVATANGGGNFVTIRANIYLN